MKLLTRAVTAAALCAVALVGSTPAASAAPPPTPKQQQARCIAAETVRLVKAVDRKVWKDKAAREAALRSAVEQAKKNCPLGGSPSNPTQQYANLVVPTADEVVDLGDGTYSFNYKRTLPANPALNSQTPFLDIIRLCPTGWTNTIGGLVDYENEANRQIVGFFIEPVDGQSYDSGERYVLVVNGSPPVAPLGTTIKNVCRPPAA